jgi:hypothetical protein
VNDGLRQAGSDDGKDVGALVDGASPMVRCSGGKKAQPDGDGGGSAGTAAGGAAA